MLPACRAVAADDAATELQFGGAVDHDTQTGSSRLGPGVSIEITPVPGWLQLELGVNAFRAAGGTNWESDLAFKVPFDLAPSIELTVGIGPTWTHAGGRERGDYAGAEFSLDFQFWTGKRTGWYIEPSYALTSAHGTEHSAGVAVGLLYAFK